MGWPSVKTGMAGRPNELWMGSVATVVDEKLLLERMASSV